MLLRQLSSPMVAAQKLEAQEIQCGICSSSPNSSKNQGSQWSKSQPKSECLRSRGQWCKSWFKSGCWRDRRCSRAREEGCLSSLQRAICSFSAILFYSGPQWIRWCPRALLKADPTLPSYSNAKLFPETSS